MLTNKEKLGERSMAETVTIGNEEYKFKIKNPTDRDYSQADIYSSQVFSKLAKQRDDDGKPVHMLRAQLDDYLKDSGIYTEDDLLYLTELSKKMTDLSDSLYKGGITKAEGKKIALELRQVRLEFIMLLNDKAKYDKHTIEHHCENARFHYLVTKCIVFENDEPVFKSVDDYETDTIVKPHLTDLLNTLGGIVSSFDPDFDKNLPENKFLLKFGYCNEEYDLVNEEGKRVNYDGELINDEGELVDSDGNLIPTEENNDIGDFTEDEPVEPTKPKSKPRAKRKTKTAKTAEMVEK